MVTMTERERHRKATDINLEEVKYWTMRFNGIFINPFLKSDDQRLRLRVREATMRVRDFRSCEIST